MGSDHDQISMLCLGQDIYHLGGIPLLNPDMIGNIGEALRNGLQSLSGDSALLLDGLGCWARRRNVIGLRPLRQRDHVHQVNCRIIAACDYEGIVECQLGALEIERHNDVLYRDRNRCFCCYCHNVSRAFAYTIHPFFWCVFYLSEYAFRGNRQ